MAPGLWDEDVAGMQLWPVDDQPLGGAGRRLHDRMMKNDPDSLEQ